jgi:hypothetical protein
MKVGDIVKQSGNLVEFHGQKIPQTLGVIIAIESSEEQSLRFERTPSRFSEWQNFLGRNVTVLWANDRLMSIASNTLEVIGD